MFDVYTAAIKPHDHYCYQVATQTICMNNNQIYTYDKLSVYLIIKSYLEKLLVLQ